MNRRNFTTISDQDLAMGLKYNELLDPLLYFKVLKTKTLFNMSTYPHGLKSFRKLLKKFEQHEFIGMITEDRFSEKLIYPKESLLRESKGNRWKDYFVHDTSLPTIKIHWQIAYIARVMGNFKKCDKYESYINSEGPYYDFHIAMESKTRIFYDLHAFFFDQNSEEKQLKKLFKAHNWGGLYFSILFVNQWDESLQGQLIQRYIRQSERPYVAWCFLHPSHTSWKDIQSSPLITLDKSMTLGEFVTGAAEKMTIELQTALIKEKSEEEVSEEPPAEEQGINALLLLILMAAWAFFLWLMFSLGVFV